MEQPQEPPTGSGSGGGEEEDSGARHLSLAVFRNVPPAYIPEVAIECHYSLAPELHPHAKDWVGIFKEGWRRPRDYVTFLWSPLPEERGEQGKPAECSVQFQAYYLPREDAHSYCFCYVSHEGRVCGVSTPFRFRRPRHSGPDELLAMEEDALDVLVVTTRSELLQKRLLELQEEGAELRQLQLALEEERGELQEKLVTLEATLRDEKDERDALGQQLAALRVREAELGAECEQGRHSQEEALARLHLLESDIAALSSKLLAKETHIDRFKDQLRKLGVENEHLRSQMKKVLEEKELYKEHLRGREVEEKELLEELGALRERLSVREAESASCRQEVASCREQLAQAARDQEELARVREELRVALDQLGSGEQRLVLLSEELARAASARDSAIAELYRQRLDGDSVRGQLVAAERAAHESREAWEVERDTLVHQAQEVKDRVAGMSENIHKLLQSLQEERLLNSGLQRKLKETEECGKVQLSEKLRELREMKAALAVLRNEKQTLEVDRQRLQEHVKELERGGETKAVTAPVVPPRAAPPCPPPGAPGPHGPHGPPGPPGAPAAQPSVGAYLPGPLRPYSESCTEKPAAVKEKPPLELGGAERKTLQELARVPDVTAARPAPRGAHVVCSQPGPCSPRLDSMFDWPDSLTGFGDEDDAMKLSCSPPLSPLSRHLQYLDFESLAAEPPLSSRAEHKECPQCGMVFPPAYDHSLFEKHVSKH
ncbi:calcium-binding and coiled-coil domain-containing protein 1-like [Lampetra fluviatilis]